MSAEDYLAMEFAVGALLGGWFQSFATGTDLLSTPIRSDYFNSSATTDLAGTSKVNCEPAILKPLNGAG